MKGGGGGGSGASAYGFPAKRRWKGLVIGVLGLVFLSMLVPLVFLLGLYNGFHTTGNMFVCLFVFFFFFFFSIELILGCVESDVNGSDLFVAFTVSVGLVTSCTLSMLFV